MKFKLHDVVTTKGNASDNIPMVVIAKGVDGYDWILFGEEIMVLANESGMCLWEDRGLYITKEEKKEKVKSIKNLWGIL